MVSSPFPQVWKKQYICVNIEIDTTMTAVKFSI